MKSMSYVFLASVTVLGVSRFWMSEAPAQESTVPPRPPAAAETIEWESGPYRIYEKSETDVADLIRYLSATDLTPAKRIEKAAKQSIGTPYLLNAAMYDHHEADCVTLVERVLAIGLADSWEQYVRLVARFRYADGMIPFAPSQFSITDGRILPHNRAYEKQSLLNRNQFIVADWNRNNAWCLRDITTELGGGEIKPWIPMHHIARRQTLYAREGLEVNVPDEKVIDAFIPRESIEEILPELRPGDVVQVVRGSLENRFCDHMEIFIRETRWLREYGDAYMVHACEPKVRREPILLFLKKFPGVQGFKFLRLVPDVEMAVADADARMTTRMNVPAPSPQ